jgi:hypothetical protein
MHYQFVNCYPGLLLLIRESERMKNLLVLLALLFIAGCAGHLASFSGSMDNQPDYYTYAGEGYGYPQIWPIGDGF